MYQYDILHGRGVEDWVGLMEGEGFGAMTVRHSESHIDCTADIDAGIVVAAVVGSVDDGDDVVVAGDYFHCYRIEGTDYCTDDHSDSVSHNEIGSADVDAVVADSLDCLFEALVVVWGTC